MICPEEGPDPSASSISSAFPTSTASSSTDTPPAKRQKLAPPSTVSLGRQPDVNTCTHAFCKAKLTTQPTPRLVWLVEEIHRRNHPDYCGSEFRSIGVFPTREIAQRAAMVFVSEKLGDKNAYENLGGPHRANASDDYETIVVVRSVPMFTNHWAGYEIPEPMKEDVSGCGHAWGNYVGHRWQQGSDDRYYEDSTREELQYDIESSEDDEASNGEPEMDDSLGRLPLEYLSNVEDSSEQRIED